MYWCVVVQFAACSCRCLEPCSLVAWGKGGDIPAWREPPSPICERVLLPAPFVDDGRFQPEATELCAEMQHSERAENCCASACLKVQNRVNT